MGRRVALNVERCTTIVQKYVQDARELVSDVCQLPELYVSVKKLYGPQHEDVMGYGNEHTKQVLINARIFYWFEHEPVAVRQVVYHELVHAWFRVSHHTDRCPLMSEYMGEVMSLGRLNDVFRWYAERYAYDLFHAKIE